jgi:hypothetical protein
MEEKLEGRCLRYSGFSSTFSARSGFTQTRSFAAPRLFTAMYVGDCAQPCRFISRQKKRTGVPTNLSPFAELLPLVRSGSLYLDDPQRRELFRLAHAHGSLLGVVMVIAAMWARSAGVRLSRLVVLAVRFGAAVMPIGFLVAGLWHPESDPGVAIWLVPAGALPLIFGLISIALSSRVTK